MPFLRPIAVTLTAVALTAGSLVATAVTAGPASAAAAPAPVVTPASARVAMTKVAQLLSKAGQSYDLRLQDTVDAGAAKVADDADFRLSKAVGYASYKPFTWSGTTLLVPRQTAYPATFLALTHYKGAGSPASKDVVALAFQRASSKASWKLVADLGFGTAPVPAFRVGKDGYLPTLVPSTLMVTPTAMYAALVKAQNVAARGGKPSAAWAYNSLWKQYLSQTKAEAVDSHETFSSSHREPLCFAATAGALCLTATTEVHLQTSTPAELASGVYWTISTQDQQYDAGGLPPGNYATIRTVAQRQLAVVIPRAKKSAQLLVTAEFWSPVAGKGTLAPAAQG